MPGAQARRPGADIAEKLIDDCMQLTLAERSSPVTADMANGALKTVYCLEAQILRQLDTLFDPDDVKREDVEKWLYEIGALRSFYGALYSNNRSCDLSCGTIQLMRYQWPHIDVLKTMIRDMMAVREDEGFKMHIWNQQRRKKGEIPD
jgi:hypothetical protein